MYTRVKNNIIISAVKIVLVLAVGINRDRNVVILVAATVDVRAKVA